MSRIAHTIGRARKLSLHIRAALTLAFLTAEAFACVPVLPPQCGPECTILPILFGSDSPATPGSILVSPTSGLMTSEAGGTGQFTIALASEPSATVTIKLSTDNAGEGTPAPASVNLTAANWNTPQPVTVTGIDDAATDGNQSYNIVTAPAVSTDAQYSGVDAADVSLTNQDDDSPNVLITQSGGTTTATEGGAGDSYTIVLATQPTANVNVTITPDAQVTANASAAPIMFTFTTGACPGPGNWCTAQTVTVAATNDAIAEGAHNGILTHTVASGDAAYNGIAIGDVTTGITDNDTAGVTITQSGGTTTATEGGAGDSYTIVLATQPTANVTVAITPDAQVTANASAAPIMFTFTTGACPGPGNWCTAQTVTVAAVDDAATEGAHNGTFTHAATSGDAAYNGIVIGSVATSITDNDGNKRMFITAGTHNGGFDVDAALNGGTFGATNSDGNGIPEADNFCDTDANHPAAGTGTFRAFMVDGVNRIASVSPNAGDGQVNWVLAANRNYVRIDGTTPIVTTNANRIFVFGSLTNSTGTGSNRYWTGLNPNWITSPRHCTNWTINTGGPNQGEKGRENGVAADAISGGGGPPQCNQLHHVLCVEQ